MAVSSFPLACPACSKNPHYSVSPETHTTVYIRGKGTARGLVWVCLRLVEPTAAVRKQTLTDIFIDEGIKMGDCVVR
jgi:hypothetical protein